jgi:replication-associated recombination protein RarA
MEPLAARLRPKNLDEFVGQEHLVGEGKPLRVAIEASVLIHIVGTAGHREDDDRAHLRACA